jgi:YidC/Oxa1 family membrane protein insertase
MPISANIIESAFSPLIKLFEWILVFIHDHILGISWGLAIVGLTIVVRAVLVPLTMKQFRSMREMQVLQPQLKELQAKYKDDRQRQSEEMMKLYKEHGVNPFASCLPLVLQIPILISLFYMLRTDLKLNICGQQLREYFSTPTHTIVHNSEIPSSKLANIGCSQVPGAHHSASFLFIPDITLKATGVVLAVLIALYIVTQLGSGLLMATSGDRNQRLLMLGLPLIFIFFFIQYPAGLLVYWITTNIWTIGQQYYVRRRLGPPPAPPPKADKAKPSADGRPKREPEPVLVGPGTDSRPSDTSAPARPSGPPPRSPRKKKKRSGRRR